MTWERVTVVTKPTLRPTTLALIKAHTRVEIDVDDALLTQYLDGAVAQIDGPSGIGFALMQQTWRLSLDCFPRSYRETIVLPGAPVKSVTSINYVDTDGANQTVDSADYLVDVRSEPARIEPAYGMTWPNARDQLGAVWVDYVLGESDINAVPQDFFDAICLMIGHRYENREEVAVANFSKLPMGAQSILERHRRHVVAA